MCVCRIFSIKGCSGCSGPGVGVHAQKDKDSAFLILRASILGQSV